MTGGLAGAFRGAGVVGRPADGVPRPDAGTPESVGAGVPPAGTGAPRNQLVPDKTDPDWAAPGPAGGSGDVIDPLAVAAGKALPGGTPAVALPVGAPAVDPACGGDAKGAPQLGAGGVATLGPTGPDMGGCAQGTVGAEPGNGVLGGAAIVGPRPIFPPGGVAVGMGPDSVNTALVPELGTAAVWPVPAVGSGTQSRPEQYGQTA